MNADICMRPGHTWMGSAGLEAYDIPKQWNGNMNDVSILTTPVTCFRIDAAIYTLKGRLLPADVWPISSPSPPTTAIPMRRRRLSSSTPTPHILGKINCFLFFLLWEGGRRRLIGWGKDKGLRLDTICAPIWERRGWCHCRHQEKGKIVPQKESSETMECDNATFLWRIFCFNGGKINIEWWNQCNDFWIRLPVCTFEFLFVPQWRVEFVWCHVSPRAR